MKVIVEAYASTGLWHYSPIGTAAYLDLYALQPFQSLDGQAILSGQFAIKDAYLRVVCEVQAGNVLYIPSFEIDSTLDSPTNPAARYGAVIRDYRNVVRVVGWPLGLSNWSLTNVASQTWEDIINRNSGQFLGNPPATYLNQTQVQGLIDTALGARDFASETRLGVTALDVDPTDPAFPIAVGVNSPLLGNDDDASSTVKGITKLTVDPVSPTDPIAVGANDPSYLALLAASSLTNTRLAKTAAYTLVNADKGKTIALGGGAYYTLTVGAASGFDAAFMVILLNEDTVRAKLISVSGGTNFYLYPGQTAILYTQNNVWQVFRSPRWQCPSGTIVHVNGASGNDSNDGLATGAGALATPQAAINRIKADFDLRNVGATPVVIQVADGTYTASGTAVVLVNGPWWGHQPTTSTFPSANEVPVLMKGNAATPANVVFTSTGFSCVLVAYSILGIQDIKLTCVGSGALLHAGMGEIQFGNLILGACTGEKIFSAHSSTIENYSTFYIEGNSATVLMADNNGSIYLSSGTSIVLLSNITVSFFAFSQRVSDITLVNVTINLNGFTVTGSRFATESSASIVTGTEDLNYFPGTTPGVIAGFGTYDRKDIINPNSGYLQVGGRGDAFTLIGNWITNPLFTSISLNGSSAANDFNLLGGLSDDTLFINRPAGANIIFREANNTANQMFLAHTSGNLGIGTSVPTSKLHVVGIPVFATNAAALAGGLTAGAFYRTGADPDPLCIVH